MTPRTNPIVECLVFLALMYAAYLFGAHNARQASEAAKVKPMAQAIESHNQKAARAQQVEKTTIAAVAQNNAVFDLIDAEVKKYAEKIPSNDDCGLDADGLRLWRAANAGAEPAGAGQSDDGLPEGAAATGQRQEIGSAGQSHRSGADLPQLPQVVPRPDRLDGGNH